jgi:hypothetical protein
MLRKKGVVGKFVEFFGPGLDNLTLADRSTIANMGPEYGATCGFFPVDKETLAYLELTGRKSDRVELVERSLVGKPGGLVTFDDPENASLRFGEKLGHITEQGDLPGMTHDKHAHRRFVAWCAQRHQPQLFQQVWAAARQAVKLAVKEPRGQIDHLDDGMPTEAEVASEIEVCRHVTRNGAH